MLLEIDFDFSPYTPERPRLSSLGNDMYWQYMEIKNPLFEEVTLSKKLRFTHGSVIEKEIIKYCQEKIKINSCQSPVYTGIKYNGRSIAGNIDGLIKINGEKWLFEIKTMNNGQFNKAQNESLIDANYTYYVQCQAYMHYMRLKNCIMLIYNKNNSELYENIIEYNEEFSLMQVDRLKRLVWHLENDVVPEFEYLYNDPRNRYNPYINDYPQPEMQLFTK